MGIQLDWEVESDAGHSAVEEDAMVIAAQKRRSTFNRRALIAAAVILIIGASIGWYRARIVRDEKLRVLQATVEAEALALRIGDKTKFMSLQGPANDWRAEQRAHFDQMVLQPDVIVDGTIIDIHMTNSEARVVVAMQVNDQPSQAVWLYEYMDKGWKHTSTEEEPWTQRTDVTGSFVFTYTAMNQAEVDQLKALLDGWWASAADLTHVDEPPVLAITFDPTASELKWDTNRENLILVPISEFEGGALKPDAHQRLARMLSTYWASYVLEVQSERSSSPELWLVEEVALWLESSFGGTPERPSALMYLTSSFGDDLIPAFFAVNHQTGDPNEALKTALSQQAPRQLTTEYFDNYLEAILSAVRPNQDGYTEPPMMPLIDTGSLDGSGMSVGVMMLSGGQPGSVVIESVKPFRDVYWVTATVNVEGDIFGEGMPGSEIQTTTMILPFREIDGFYQVSAIKPDDWGGRIVEQSQYVTFQYFELDASYYAGAVTQFEQDYLQAAAIFGITDPPHITIRVADDFNEAGMPLEEIAPVIYSPHAICCFPGYEAEEFARMFYIYQLYSAIFNAQAGEYSTIGGTPASSMFEAAIMQVAVERAGQDVSLFYGFGMGGSLPPDVELPTSLDQFWFGIDSGTSQIDWNTQQLGAAALIDVLLERYGDQALLPLTQNLRQSTTMAEWLETSLGITTRDVEDQWLVRFRERVQEHSGS